MSERDFSPHSSDRELQEAGLQAFRTLFSQIDQKDQLIEARIRSGAKGGCLLPVEFSVPYRIWHREKLKLFAIQHRAMLLPADQFFGEIPLQVIREVNRLEVRMGQSIKGLVFLVPAAVFGGKGNVHRGAKLLAALPDGRWAELHQWGMPFHWGRRRLLWPLRNLANSIATILAFAFLAAFILLPERIILGPEDGFSFPLRVVFFFYVLLGTSGIAVLHGFSKVKHFSEELWESSYSEIRLRLNAS